MERFYLSILYIIMKKINFRTAAFAGMLCVSFGVSGQAPAPGWFVPSNEETGLVIDTGLQVLPCAVDINNDDYPDIVSIYFSPGGNYFSERKPMMIHLNVQDPDSDDPKARKFIDITAQSGIHDIPGDTGYHANCYTLADFNNDGNVDIVTGNFYGNASTYKYPQDRCQIFLGDGKGNFTYKPDNGLSAIGLRNIRMLTALDYDRDGNLDLFIATFYQSSHTGVLDHGYLLRGNGDGTFSDMTDASGLGSYYEAMYGSSSTDYNDDCLPDIFTAPYCRSGGMVLKNQGDGTFVDMAPSLGYDLELPGAGGQRSCTFSVIPEDVNNDGLVDLFFSVVHGGNAPGQFRSTIGFNKGPDHNYAFTINENVLPVSPPASSHRGDYDGSFIDFDNDGLKDLVMVQGTYMAATDRTYFWQQQPDNTFKDVTAALGLLLPELKSTGAVDVFDYDLDGDDDILIGGQATGALQLWKNTVGHTKNYIAVRILPMANRGINLSGIGTRVYVYYEGKMQMREVLAGRGQHTGQQPFILNFGLGDAQKVDSVVIRWPDAQCSRKTVYNPPVNNRLVVNSFPVGVEEVPAPVEVKVFPNPASRYVIVQEPKLNSRLREARMTDITGKSLQVKQSKSDGDKLIFDLASLPDGVYFILMHYNNGKQESHKLTLQR